MSAVPRWARPSLLAVTLAGAAEAAALLAQYRTEFTDVGMGAWSHSYWPWYVHSHGDNVTAPDPLLFALNFLTGLLLFLPVAHLLGLGLRQSGRWPPGLLAGRPVLRPGLAKTALALAAVPVLSLVGAGPALNLFAAPGYALVVAAVVLLRTFGSTPQLSGGLGVAYACSLPLLWLAVSWLYEGRPGPLPGNVALRRWALGRDRGLAREHLLGCAAGALAVGTVVAAAEVAGLFPEYATWYDYSVVGVALAVATAQAARNDGLLVSWLAAAAAIWALRYPVPALLGPNAPYVRSTVETVAGFGLLLGTAGFCLGLAGRWVAARAPAVTLPDAAE